MGVDFKAAIFDMDGVVTRTADLHAAAWKELFDDFLQKRAAPGQPYQPFDSRAEYLAHVDGKPRSDGVRAFLQARGITAGNEELEDLAQRKDVLFERRLHERGVELFASTVALIQALRIVGVKTGVVTSSRHGREILRTARIETLFDAKLDGIDLRKLALKGKPDPDIYVKAAQLLEATPGRVIVFEDAVAGVRAGRRGGFGLVVGVDRGGNAGALASAGADLVVHDLAELDVERLDHAFAARREERAWCIEAEGFEAARESQMESLFAVGNGYLGLRGALDVPPPGAQPDLFVAGIFGPKCAELPYSEIEFLTPERGNGRHTELVPLPFPLRLAISIQGEALGFARPEGGELRRTLDLRSGSLRIEATVESTDGRRTTFRTRRCASLADPHLLLQEVAVVRENHWADVELQTSLEEPDLRGHHPHLEQAEHLLTPDLELVRYTTRASGFEVCIASRELREPLRLRRLVCIFTNRDGQDPRAAVLRHLQELEGKDFDSLFADHAREWAGFWHRADIRVGGRPAVEQALRFGSYHLRLPAGDDARVSVGARALTGRAYEGHVFWDTEIFMLPFHLYSDPDRARTLLLYRHHTLDGARRHARGLGYRGACFAWESTVTGDDVTPSKILIRSTGKEIPIFTGSQQVHDTADVAYAIWRYWEATQDEAFLAGPGTDILVETARFWASRVTPRGSRHHILGVVGPDEYHHTVNDNAYTNWMARFNLERASWAAQRAGVHGDEAQEWSELARSLYCPAPGAGAGGVIEQFEGFFALADYKLPRAERFRAPASRLFDWDHVNRLKLLKQADVLMLPLLFPDAFSDEVVAANYRYYEPITDHGSSLSPAVHAAIAARIGLLADAQRYWKEALWLDLTNAMDNSMLGVHLAAMGGSWQALVFGFLGIRFTDAGPRADPQAPQRLPLGWKSVELTLKYRGALYEIKVKRP